MELLSLLLSEEVFARALRLANFWISVGGAILAVIPTLKLVGSNSLERNIFLNNIQKIWINAARTTFEIPDDLKIESPYKRFFIALGMRLLPIGLTYLSVSYLVGFQNVFSTSKQYEQLFLLAMAFFVFLTWVTPAIIMTLDSLLRDDPEKRIALIGFSLILTNSFISLFA